MPLFFDNEAIGALCVIDHTPRAWTDERRALRVPGSGAEREHTEIELRSMMLAARERQALFAAVLEGVGDAVLAIAPEESSKAGVTT